jgi:hypothetical protein
MRYLLLSVLLLTACGFALNGDFTGRVCDGMAGRDYLVSFSQGAGGDCGPLGTRVLRFGQNDGPYCSEGDVAVSEDYCEASVTGTTCNFHDGYIVHVVETYTRCLDYYCNRFDGTYSVELWGVQGGLVCASEYLIQGTAY